MKESEGHSLNRRICVGSCDDMALLSAAGEFAQWRTGLHTKETVARRRRTSLISQVLLGRVSFAKVWPRRVDIQQCPQSVIQAWLEALSSFW
jgi:uncharacterized protein (DUF2384 family)